MDASDYRRELVDRYATTHAAHFVERDASWYAERARYFHHRLGRFLPADRDAPILDAACGAGEVLHYLRDRGYRAAWGVDLSEEQLGHARRMGIENVSKVELLTHLEGSAGRYACIIASHVLEHLRKPELIECLGLMSRALSAGGRLLVLTPNAGSPLGLPYSLGDFTHEIHFTGMSLAQVAALSGLDVVCLDGVRPESRGWRGRVKRVVWDWLLGPGLRSLLGDKRMKYGNIMEPELIGVFASAPG